MIYTCLLRAINLPLIALKAVVQLTRLIPIFNNNRTVIIMRYTVSFTKIPLLICCIILSIFSYSFAAQADIPSAQIVVVIDDIGYNKEDINAVTLPHNVTLSVLPKTPYAKRYAALANREGKDILLHIPMDSLSGRSLGPAALTSDMNQIQIQQSLYNSLNDFPFAIGINNHMGSLLTQMPEPMKWTMQFLKQHQLCFLDSRTTKHTQAERIANSHGVKTLRRHVFLDNKTTDEYLAQQFNLLVATAKTQGLAIGIAHPHPQTITFLKNALAKLPDQHIELVSLSNALGDDYSPIALAQASRIAAEKSNTTRINE